MQASGNSQSVVLDNEILSATGIILDTIWNIDEVVWEHVPLSGSAMRQHLRLGEPLLRNYGQRSRDSHYAAGRLNG